MKMVCPRCGRRYPAGTEICQEDQTQLAPVIEDPYLNHQLGKYILEKRIGRGGFGVVYLARHINLGNKVAIKILKKQFITDKELVERFRIEARVASQIAHENVVQTLDFGFDEDLGFYYVMEFLDGASLSFIMKEYPFGMPVKRMLPIIRQICGALTQAHAIGVVHRDLKPSNILLIKRFQQDDITKILDFGIAKVLQGQEGKGVTVTGQIVGSPRFMSPEQARGRHSEIDPRSDIYSLGIITFWMLTGRLPFESKQLARLLYMHVKTPPPTLSDTHPHKNFPQVLEDIVAAALEKDKSKRPSGANEFYQRLERACQSVQEHPKQSQAASQGPFPSSPPQNSHGFLSRAGLSTGAPPSFSTSFPEQSSASMSGITHPTPHSSISMSGVAPASVSMSGTAHPPQSSSNSLSYAPASSGVLPPGLPTPKRYPPPQANPFAQDEEDDDLDMTRVDNSCSDVDQLTTNLRPNTSFPQKEETPDPDMTLVISGKKGALFEKGYDDEIRTVMEVPHLPEHDDITTSLPEHDDITTKIPKRDDITEEVSWSPQSYRQMRIKSGLWTFLLFILLCGIFFMGWWFLFALK